MVKTFFFIGLGYSTTSRWGTLPSAALSTTIDTPSVSPQLG